MTCGGLFPYTAGLSLPQDRPFPPSWTVLAFDSLCRTYCSASSPQSKPRSIVESSSMLTGRDLIMRSSWGLSYVKTGQGDAGTECKVNLQ